MTDNLTIQNTGKFRKSKIWNCYNNLQYINSYFNWPRVASQKEEYEQKTKS